MEDYVTNIEKIRRSLEEEGIDNYTKIRREALLRYYLGEQEEEKEKVKYNASRNELDLSESLRLAEQVIEEIAKELQLNGNELGLEKMQELNKLMKDNFYYLSRYLFSYYLISIEFGIPKEKQFYAPRDMVLGPIAKRLDIFYYKPRAVLALNMPQGTGKEQPLSSKILTPTGWITMGDVKVGTKVIGADGKACNVTGVYPKGIKDVYRVTFDDHTYVDCGLEHLWEVKTREDRRRKKEARVVNTQQMLKDYKIKEKDGIERNNYSVRLVKPIEFENELTKNDLAPYLLGCLIGNGSLGKEQIRITEADEEVLNKIKENLPLNTCLKKYNQQYQYGIVRKSRKGQKGNPVVMALKKCGLLCKKSYEKFIPSKYLFSSIDNRIELLRGLMDADGNSFSNSSGAQYTTTSKILKDDIIELVQSLGGKARFREEKNVVSKIGGKIIKSNKTVYRVYFSLDINPFYLKRKAEQFNVPQFNYQKMIVNIKKIRQEKCQCIMVDSPEHLYVTDGYTLTHNTEIGKRFMSWVIGKEPDLANMMVSYSASIAKDKFYNGVITIIDDENGNFQKIFPNLECIYKNAETMSLDYANDGRRRPHSEYTLYCAGFDGGITGRTRAHNVLYLDDLVKNMEAANNKDVMDKMNDEFNATLRKRMQGNCKMLIIGTLFSINDPFTRTITYFKENAPDRIEVLRLPRTK